MENKPLIWKAGIPAKYEPVITIASYVGDKLGEKIAFSWDKFIDKLFKNN